MKLTTLTPGLSQLDSIHHDTLVLHHFVEDRPLKGLAGFVDWRLNGWLSRLLVRGWTSARFRETLLIPGGARLRVNRLLLVGLGSRDDYNPERLRLVSLHVMDVLRRMRVTEFALGVPGLEALKVGPRQAADTLLTAFHQTMIAPTDEEQDFDVCFLVPESAMQDVVDPIHSFEVRYRRR